MKKGYLKVNDIVWQEFNKTGKIGMYMLYSALEKDDDDGIA